MLLLTIVPRGSRDNASGVNFYKGILKFSREKDYRSRMEEISVAEILEDYLSSIYMIARIEEKKYTRLKLAFVSSFIAIGFVGSAVIFNILLFHK